MYNMDQFEYALPELKPDIEKLVIETTGGYEGSITLKNNGGGILEGQIFSNSNLLSFHPESFQFEESLVVHFSLNMDYFREGDQIQTECVITSNGGEIVIPTIIKFTKGLLLTRTKEKDSTVKISDLKGFVSYAKKNPVAARALFNSHEFMIWLFDIGYEPMNVYEKFLKDTNKERSLEKFLLFNKLKNRVALEFTQPKLEYIIPSGTKEYKETITVKKTGWGYADCLIYSDQHWLLVQPEKLTSASFDEGGLARVQLSMDTEAFEQAAEATLFLSQGVGLPALKSISLSVKKSRPFLFSINQEAFASNDKGYLTIENLCGADSFVEVFSPDSFVKLEAKRYPLRDRVMIPFTIKLSALQSAQMSFKKQPYLEGVISMKIVLNYKVHKKDLKLKVFSVL